RGAVALSVCDATGRLVRTLIDGPQAPGRHAVQWDGTAHDGRQAPAGVYFYRLSVGGEMVSKRVLCVR
ncbi:MAG: hypothetical protein KAY24_17610, partial [Candidatus Eisenbacteria sp.]|nr:hypothetical protein [Candidatus Eisenbacteria bacterium]